MKIAFAAPLVCRLKLKSAKDEDKASLANEKGDGGNFNRPAEERSFVDWYSRCKRSQSPKTDVWLADEMSKMKAGHATPRRVGGFLDRAPVRAGAGRCEQGPLR